VSELEFSLNEMQRNADLAQKQITIALDVLNSMGTFDPQLSSSHHAGKAASLIGAYRSAIHAQELYPSLPEVNEVLTKLDVEYSSRFNALAKSETLALAEVYYRALAGANLDSTNVDGLVAQFESKLTSLKESRRRPFTIHNF
ncbi:MAG: hypothetical protein R3228_04515, partial [Halioglobus sp.]|nr:hypothetical protein [Halioglobus sp.]